MTPRRTRSIAVLVCTVSVLSALPAAPGRAATTYTFTGKGSNDSWNTEKNWDPEGTPEAGDSVQIPANMGDVRDAPSVTLENLSLGKNSYLDIKGNLLTVQTLQWGGGIIYGSVTVTGAATIMGAGYLGTLLAPGGPQPAVLTLLGPTVLTDTLYLEAGQRIENHGDFAAAAGAIDGRTCCTDPAAFDNEGTLTGGDLNNMRYIGNNGADTVGSVQLRGGSHRLKNGTRIRGVLEVLGADLDVEGTLRMSGGAKLIQGGPQPGDRTHVTGTFTLQGPPSGSPATWEWLGGITYASMTLGKTAGLTIASAAQKQLNGASPGLGVGVLTVPQGATVTQGDAPLNLAGTIRNRGTWRVRNGADATIVGNGVTRPFINHGLVDVRGATLGILNSRMALAKEAGATTAGRLKGGLITVVGGELDVSDGARLEGADAVLHLDDGALVTGPGGSLTLRSGAEIDQRDASVLTSLTVRGTGSWSFGSGYLSAPLDLGENVALRFYEPSSAPISKRIQTQSGAGVTLTTRGSTFQTGNPVDVVPGTRIINEGDWNVRRGGFRATSTVAQFVNRDTLTVDTDDPRPVGFVNMKLVQRGTFTVDRGSVFTIGTDSVQSAGTTRLNGTLETGASYRIAAGILAGGGTVRGHLINAARVAPGDGLGRLTVTGDYTQTAAGRLVVELSNARSDRLVAGEANLDGRLQLVLKQSRPLSKTARTLVTGDTVTGSPSVLFGQLPAAQWTVVVAATAVRLVPR